MQYNDANIHGVNGDLFAGNPSDFFCLNNGFIETENWDADEYELPPADSSGYISCLWEQEPPIARHTLKGMLTFDASKTNLDPDDTTALRNAMAINTSDGQGNCLALEFKDATGKPNVKKSVIECYGNDWGSGWSGKLFLSYNETLISCMPSTIIKNNVTGLSTGNDFNCVVGDKATDPDPDAQHTMSGTVTLDTSKTNLNTAEIDAWLNSIKLTSSDGNNNCSALTFKDTAQHIKEATVDCQLVDGWSGSLSLTDDADLLSCNPASITKSNVKESLTGNDFNCVVGNKKGPVMITATISGTVNTDGNGRLATATLANATCTVTSGGLAYSCTTEPFDQSKGFTGEIIFGETSGKLCNSPGINSAKAAITGIKSDADIDIFIRKNNGECKKINF